MPQCTHLLTTTGAACPREGIPHEDVPGHIHFCRQHRTTYDRRRISVGAHHTPGKCIYFNNRSWCTHDSVNDMHLCDQHTGTINRLRARAQAQLERNQHVRILREMLMVEPRTWREMVHAFAVQVDDNHVMYQAVMEVYLQRHEGPLHFFQMYWTWVETGMQGPEPVMEVIVLPPPPPRGLDALARDPQNVHTQAVSAQTNASTEKLLEAIVPEDQQTEKSIVRAWVISVPCGWNRMLITIRDVNTWFTTKTCRAPDDALYRRMLRGLVAIINRTDEEQRAELYKRLWEECNESVGMCCEGHISRLCNVLVGFDDAFQPAIALGELMQQKMAAISGLDVPEEEKRRQANQWFDEHAVPEADRAAWLDAF